MRTVLACASGGTASDGAIEIACRLARQFNAHLEGFHVRLDARALFIHTGAGMGTPLLTEWCDQLEGEAAEKASRTATAFAAAVGRHGLTRADHPPISGPSASWHEEIGYAPALVPARARFFDLAVL